MTLILGGLVVGALAVAVGWVCCAASAMAQEQDWWR
jgi:hypothetical protein